MSRVALRYGARVCLSNENLCAVIIFLVVKHALDNENLCKKTFITEVEERLFLGAIVSN